jgi:hypothetical protein
MKRTYTLSATLVALVLAGGLAPSVAQQSVVDGFRLPNGGYQFVTPTVGLPVANAARWQAMHVNASRIPETDRVVAPIAADVAILFNEAASGLASSINITVI